MKKLLSILVIFFAFLIKIHSQKHEMDNVTIAELSEKVNPTDSTIVATILFKTAETKFDFSGSGTTETIVNFKIKIYKKEGLKEADFKITYFDGDDNQSVTFSNAATYNLVDGKIIKTKLTSAGEFKEKLNKNFVQKKILLPAAKEGSIIEFTYKHTTPIGGLNDFRFQALIPINYVEYNLYIPDWFIFNTTLTGYERIDNSVIIMSNSSSIKKNSYIGKNIPAFEPETYVNNISNYLSAIKFELALIKRESRPDINLATTWEGIATKIYQSDYFGGELSKKGYFEEDLKIILKEVTNRDEKIKIILNYLKSKVKWNEYIGYYCDIGLKKAYKESKGNVAEINLMLIAMLRFAGIEANPILISTRDNGVSFSPTSQAFNYVIAGVEIENDLILLDATDKNSSLNIIPIRDLNWTGRIIRENNSSAEVSLFPKMSSINNINLIATITKEGFLEGQIKQQYFDYNAFVFRNTYTEGTPENYIEKLEKKYNNIEINDHQIEGLINIDQPLIERYSFKNNNSVEFIGDKIIISPLLFFAIKENPFKLENRRYPVDFIYPNQDRFFINLTIPDGYEIETLPDSVTIPMTDNLINVKYQIASTGNKIQLSYIKNINTSIVSPEYYDELKGIFNEIVKKETEKIVLKKI